MPSTPRATLGTTITMPIYAYRCSACGHAQDVLQKISDPLLTVCPACGQASYVKQVTAAGFQLKGSGWYVTDFRNNGASAKPAEGKGEDKAASGDKPAEGGGDAKAAAAPAAPAAGAAPAAASAPAPAAPPKPAAAPPAAS
jgi:putative FmdB family regulatory protein